MVRVRVFIAPVDITAPGAIEDVQTRARQFADTLFLESEGLPGNLSVHAMEILRLAPLAAADARAAAQLMARIGYINRLLAVWPTLKAAQAAKQYGARGGRQPKRRLWAAEVAVQLAQQNHPTEGAAWAALPGPEAAWEIETDDADFEVYAEHDSLIAVDANTRQELRPLKMSTFLKNYYRPARQSRM